MDEWNATIKAEGFELVLDAFNLRTDSGYRPAMLKGAESGFEWYLSPVAKAEELPQFPFKAHIGNADLKADLCFTSYADEDVTSAIAGAVLAKLTRGYYWNPEIDDHFYQGEDAIAAARLIVQEWERRGPWKPEPDGDSPPPLPASNPASIPLPVLRPTSPEPLYIEDYAEFDSTKGTLPPAGTFAMFNLDFKQVFPYVSWISDTIYRPENPSGFCLKILTARHEPSGELECVYLQQMFDGGKLVVRRFRLPPEDFGAIVELVNDLETRFSTYFHGADFRRVRTAAEFRAIMQGDQPGVSTPDQPPVIEPPQIHPGPSLHHVAFALPDGKGPEAVGVYRCDFAVFDARGGNEPLPASGSVGIIHIDFVSTFPHMVWGSGTSRDVEYPAGFSYKLLSVHHEPSDQYECVVLRTLFDGSKSILVRFMVPKDGLGQMEQELIPTYEQAFHVNFVRRDFSRAQTPEELQKLITGKSTPDQRPPYLLECTFEGKVRGQFPPESLLPASSPPVGTKKKPLGIVLWIVVALGCAFGLFVAMRMVQFACYAYKHPYKAPVGANELEAANLAILWQLPRIASGNNPQAVALADAYARSLRALREKNFSKVTGENWLGLPITTEVQAYCHLNTNACVFLVRIPELRQFDFDAKKSLADLAWFNAQIILKAKLDAPPPHVVVGLKGEVMWDEILTGVFVHQPQARNDGLKARYDGITEIKVLYPYFKPEESSAQSQGSR